MITYLIILFTIIPAIELYLLLKIGSVIGAANTFTIIVLTGVTGAYLARLQGFMTLKKIQENLNRGQMPSAELIDGLLILVGGMLLLTPGFLTDTIGFLLLIPLTRALIKFYLKKKFQSMIDNGQIVNIQNTSKNDYYDDIDIT